MKYLTIAIALILFSSCASDDAPKDYTEENEQEIQAFIADNNLTTQKSSSGLYYIIDNPGTGENPVATDRVKVAYKGYLTDGTIFDESIEEGVSFNFLGNLISGFAEGLTYFKEGGSGKLIIPSRLAYGSSANGNIPAGSVLIFDIELVYVNYKTENDKQIQAYLTENNLVAEKTSTGLYYIIDTEGDGAQVSLTDNVLINYKGYFLDDTVFDEPTESVNFDLKNVITGFSEGLTYFKEGGTGTLLIPSHLAYGNTDTGSIPGGAVLVFDVNVLSVN